MSDADGNILSGDSSAPVAPPNSAPVAEPSFERRERQQHIDRGRAALERLTPPSEPDDGGPVDLDKPRYDPTTDARAKLQPDVPKDLLRPSEPEELQPIEPPRSWN
jgi:hypothetical protein